MWDRTALQMRWAAGADRVTRMRCQELCFSTFVLGAAIAPDNCRHSRDMRAELPVFQGRFLSESIRVPVLFPVARRIAIGSERPLLCNAVGKLGRTPVRHVLQTCERALIGLSHWASELPADPT